MKISITDKFLWDIYSSLEKGVHIAALMVGPRRSILKILPYNYNPIIEKYRKKYGKESVGKAIHYLKSCELRNPP